MPEETKDPRIESFRNDYGLTEAEAELAVGRIDRGGEQDAVIAKIIGDRVGAAAGLPEPTIADTAPANIRAYAQEQAELAKREAEADLRRAIDVVDRVDELDAQPSTAEVGEPGDGDPAAKIAADLRAAAEAETAERYASEAETLGRRTDQDSTGAAPDEGVETEPDSEPPAPGTETGGDLDEPPFEGGGDTSSTTYDPGQYTVEEVQRYAVDHPDEAPAIAAAEVRGRNRSTLLSWFADVGIEVPPQEGA